MTKLELDAGQGLHTDAVEHADLTGSEDDLNTRLLHTLLAIAASVIVTAILAGIVQTQVNLAALTALGTPVSGTIRWQVTLEEIARFGPVMAAIVAAAFLPAFLAAHLVARQLSSSWRIPVFAIAGVVGLWVAFSPWASLRRCRRWSRRRAIPWDWR